jgi:hypothetical protein
MTGRDCVYFWAERGIGDAAAGVGWRCKKEMDYGGAILVELQAGGGARG